MGLPVIAGDSGGAPDAVLQSQTGFVVDGRDLAQVAGRVVQLLEDPSLAKAMGVNVAAGGWRNSGPGRRCQAG